MDKIILTIHGKNMTFSQEELVAIVEKHLPPKPKLFEINPQSIDRKLFEEKRSNLDQEITRKHILNAFADIENYPERYASTFYTLVPTRNWICSKTPEQLELYAKTLGGELADRTHQFLEWAQRITNGESWEDICNKPDIAKCYRLIRWRNDYYQLVGGSCDNEDGSPACDISFGEFGPNETLYLTVPLVVIKKLSTIIY